MFRQILLMGLFLSLAPVEASPAGDAIGKFIGKVVTEWSIDGRSMRILEPFEFISSDGAQWKVPIGSVVDGASIPRWAWTIIGGPFEGKYRDASVVHDVACVEKRRPWQAVHNMFYEAMLANGVGSKKAKIMFAAVYHFGPRWERSIALNAVSEDELNRQATSELGSDLKVSTTRLPSPPCTSAPCAPATTLYDAVLTYEPELTDLSLADFEKLKIAIETGDVSESEIMTYRPVQ